MTNEHREFSTQEIIFLTHEFRKVEEKIDKNTEKTIEKMEGYSKECNKLIKELINAIDALTEKIDDMLVENRGGGIFEKILQYFTTIISLLISAIALYKSMGN